MKNIVLIALCGTVYLGLFLILINRFAEAYAESHYGGSRLKALFYGFLSLFMLIFFVTYCIEYLC